MRYLRILFVVVFGCVSCNETPPKEVLEVLNKSSKNKTELEKVLAHYENTGEDEKLKAAYFLIGNMADKYGVEGEAVNDYDGIFSIFNEYHKAKKYIPKNSPVMKARWDSIVNLYGRPEIDEIDMWEDYKRIKGQYLIDNIDSAFLAYQSQWSKKISFENFCEFILPYRIYNEKIEPWRGSLMQAYKPLFDSIKGRNTFNTVKSVNTSLEKILDTNYILWGYPFDISTSNMLLGKRGSCQQIVAHTARIFRAFGIPVGIDYTPLWGDRPNGHYWNTALLEDGKIFSFEAATVPFGGTNDFHYRLSKVYRRTFALQKIDHPDVESEVPRELIDNRRIDVTELYTKAFDIKVPLLDAKGLSFKSAVICTQYRNTWKPQNWGVITNGKAQFKKMGSNLLYLVMYYKDGKYLPASLPFILTKEGKIKMVKPDYSHLVELVLTRKNPSWRTNIKNMNATIGSKFQGGNRPDFSDSVTLAIVKDKPTKFEEIVITDPRKFRYVRFLGPEKKNASLAELEVYTRAAGKDKKLSPKKIIGFPEVTKDAATPYQNVFDGDPGTYFLGGKKSAGWAGMELDTPHRISKVRFCPRSDTNFIIIGDQYELCLWTEGAWKSLGSKIATDQFVTFQHVPQNGLYLLHNLTRGKEERIFTYENGIQVWW